MHFCALALVTVYLSFVYIYVSVICCLLDLLMMTLMLFVVSEIKKLSGNGDAGYKDGDLGSAMFNKPKSFALDSKNNIYVADKTNHVIRKISKSGISMSIPA